MNHSGDPFYLSSKWKAKRDRILRRDGYQDQVAIRLRGVLQQADIVHHIFPREDYPQYAWCDWNLISVSVTTHRELHRQFDHGLTKLGQILLRQTAVEHGIKLTGRVLVIGAPGTGKSTYVRSHIGNALVYDLDHLAAAFRLSKPHEENNTAAIKMANDFLHGFIANAQDYSDRVCVIRSSPTLEEVSEFDPDKVIVCLHQYPCKRDLSRIDLDRMAQRIDEVVAWAERNGREVVRVAPPPTQGGAGVHGLLGGGCPYPNLG